MRAGLRPGGLIRVCGPLGGPIPMGLCHGGRMWVGGFPRGNLVLVTVKAPRLPLWKCAHSRNRISRTKQKMSKILQRLQRLHTLGRTKTSIRICKLFHFSHEAKNRRSSPRFGVLSFILRTIQREKDFLRLLMKLLGLPRVTMPRFPQVFNE